MKSTVTMLVLLLFGSQGCGLVVHGLTQELQINTMPQAPWRRSTCSHA